MVCDLTQKDSFKVVKKWVSELLQYAKKNIGKDFKLVLAIAGNKSDLKDQIQINISDLEKYAKVNLKFRSWKLFFK